VTALAVLGLRLRGAWLALAAALLFGLLFAGETRADTPPRITVHPSADTVEVGEAFTIELKALVDQGSQYPSDPQLKAPPNFAVEGPSISQQMFMNGLGARAQVLVGIGATWRLVARAPGKYTIAAPTVRWGGKRIAGKSVQIEVVPAGSRPRRPQFANPFLLPGIPGMPGFPGDPTTDDDDEPPAAPTGAAKELAMPSAPDPVVFVRAVPDKKSAVIGEQVTVSFYIYFSRRHLQYSTRQTATAVDFSRVLLAEDPKAEPIVTTTVGGKRFDAALMERWALFPLRAGDLHVGKVKAFVADQWRRPVGDRESDDLVIHVTEPPRAGRPVGYTVGDVGQFSLEATVQPRRIEQGGSVAVTVKVTGKGNLPQSLRLPERTGVEWLDPERKEQILPQRGVVEGWRTFGHVVRINQSGQVDLGEVTLPYWDPVAKRYQIARAPLGAIEVTPAAPAVDKDAGAAPAAEPAEAKPDPFIGMPTARASLSAFTPARARFGDGGALWLLIAAPPLFVGVISAGSGAMRRVRTRRSQAADSPGALAQKALREAEEAAARGDAKALAAALDRAVHLAVEAACGLKSRGVLLADLPEEVARRGLPQALGAAARSILEECEAIRFEPTASGERGRDLTARGKKLLADLERREVT
jgi:hypothetical protein